MSVAKIRQALENGVNAITPALETAWENVEYTPVNGTPYQRVFLLTARPDNIEYGPVYRQEGILQVNLFYPLKVGTTTAVTRAELIQTTFKRGTTFVKDTVKVVIDKTPHIKQGRRDDDRWMIPIDISFYAHLTT